MQLCTNPTQYTVLHCMAPTIDPSWSDISDLTSVLRDLVSSSLEPAFTSLVTGLTCLTGLSLRLTFGDSSFCLSTRGSAFAFSKEELIIFSKFILGSMRSIFVFLVILGKTFSSTFSLFGGCCCCFCCWSSSPLSMATAKRLRDCFDASFPTLAPLPFSNSSKALRYLQE